jgi:hypothetical protein
MSHLRNELKDVDPLNVESLAGKKKKKKKKEKPFRRSAFCWTEKPPQQVNSSHRG